MGGLNAQAEIKSESVLRSDAVSKVGLRIDELDISRHSVIILIKRRTKRILPKGDMVLRAGDRVFLYTKLHLSNANEIDIY